uniref:Reverse transcriptase domain-containing protein n=1 Tax=Myotis myotis TaxID=51298 RepID=A0A7J7XHX9_MYOMY|nr:hypothetical protein mMyoMyo1_011808 [Myotis myotis]
MFTFTTLFNIVVEILAIMIRLEEEIKSIQIGKEELKLSLFLEDMILNIANSKDHYKLLDLINECGNIAGYKINTQKLMAFLYTSNEFSERETKKIIFTIATKELRFLGINLTEEVKYLYSENYRMLKKRDRGRYKQVEEYTVFMDW